MARRNPTLQSPNWTRVPGRASRLGGRRSSEGHRGGDSRLEVVGANVEQDTIAPERDGSRAKANDALRRYWDRDSATYDLWAEHGAVSPVERAAWAYELSRFLPQRRDASLLDIGAGTGFLSLAAARLGYRVTALDISPGMLARLETAAAAEGLEIETVCAPADQPPRGPFDAVIERLALWTLPDPASALQAWKRVVVPGGQLLVFEGMWAEGGLAALRARGRALLHGLGHVPAGAPRAVSLRASRRAAAGVRALPRPLPRSTPGGGLAQPRIRTAERGRVRSSGRALASRAAVRRYHRVRHPSALRRRAPAPVGVCGRVASARSRPRPRRLRSPRSRVRRARACPGARHARAAT